MKETNIKRVAILGTESSHARAFARLLQNSKTVRLIGAYGTEEAANRGFREAFGVECSATPDAFRDEVDGVLITARNGADHLALARPYLHPGKTVFVDKPLCNDPGEAEELIALARKNRVNLCGGSCLKFALPLLRLRAAVESDPCVIGASFSAPVEMQSAYGGFLFYAPHLIEMALTVLREPIRSIRAIRQGDTVTALLRYDTFCASLFFGCDAYTAAVSFRTCGKHCEVRLDSIPSLYAKELSHFCKLLSTNPTGLPDSSSLADHVRIADAIRRAYESDTEILLN